MDDRDTSPSVPKESPATAVVAARSATPPPNAKVKILSRNANATVVMTTSPSNEAELQLYRVMQRASLLAYYDTLLEMGGDDVQQLCDAGEEEFLEIMALVGMASKPLHVRRLQKALQEWVTNPGLFQSPLLPPVPLSPGVTPPMVMNSTGVGAISGAAIVGPGVSSTPQVPSIPSPFVLNPCSAPNTNTNTICAKEVPRPRSSPLQLPIDTNQSSTMGPSTSPGPSPGSPLQLTPVLLESQISRLADAAKALVKNLPQFEPKPHNTKKKICRDLENVMTMSEDDPRRMEEIRKYAAIYGRFDCKRKPEKPLTLHEVSVNEAAAQICRFAPALLTRRDELFPLARQVVRDSGYHYSKTHTSLTPMYHTHAHHMSSRNGEDGQLLKRRRMEPASPPAGDTSDGERPRRQERLEAIADELRCLGEKTEELVTAAQQVRENNDLSAIHSLQHQMEIVQNKQTQLLLEQSDLLKQPLPMRIYRRSSGNRSAASCNEPEKADTDDTDSQLSFSNASSPSQEVGDSRDSMTENASNNNLNLNGSGKANKGKQLPNECEGDDGPRFPKNLTVTNNDDSYYQEGKVQVISASGGNIIAVANPALSMSPLLPASDALSKLPLRERPNSRLSLKLERQSPELVDAD